MRSEHGTLPKPRELSAREKELARMMVENAKRLREQPIGDPKMLMRMTGYRAVDCNAGAALAFEHAAKMILGNLIQGIA